MSLDLEKIRQIEIGLTEKFEEFLKEGNEENSVVKAFEKALKDPLGIEPLKEDDPLIDLEEELLKDLGESNPYDEWL
jgi:hypothetical protein